MPAVSIKWQGKKFDLDVDTALEPLVFKSQLFELTGVVPERQKIVFKVGWIVYWHDSSRLNSSFQGKTLKEDSWDGINLVDGSLLMMLGSVEALLEPLKVSGDSEQSFSKGTGDGGEAAIKMPCGLTNLGNTCYMNATLQSLRVSSFGCRDSCFRYIGHTRACRGNSALDKLGTAGRTTRNETIFRLNFHVV